MDDFKLPTITQEQYDSIAKLVDRAMLCRSAKEAEPYIQKIRFLADDFPDGARYKAGELASSLREYCKRNSDKYRTESYLSIQVGGLRRMIGRQDKL